MGPWSSFCQISCRTDVTVWFRFVHFASLYCFHLLGSDYSDSENNGPPPSHFSKSTAFKALTLFLDCSPTEKLSVNSLKNPLENSGAKTQTRTELKKALVESEIEEKALEGTVAQDTDSGKEEEDDEDNEEVG